MSKETRDYLWQIDTLKRDKENLENQLKKVDGFVKNFNYFTFENDKLTKTIWKARDFVKEIRSYQMYDEEVLTPREKELLNSIADSLEKIVGSNSDKITSESSKKA